MKGYCIVEIGYQYNDEYYTRSDDYPNQWDGKPRKVYKDRDKAVLECERLNREYLEVHSGLPGDYNEKTNEYDVYAEYFEVMEVELEGLR